jgi:hypothetical protein
MSRKISRGNSSCIFAALKRGAKQKCERQRIWSKAYREVFLRHNEGEGVKAPQSDCCKSRLVVRSCLKS